jgi:hypothetical protein
MYLIIKWKKPAQCSRLMRFQMQLEGTQHYLLEDSTLHSQHCENLKSHVRGTEVIFKLHLILLYIMSSK